MTAATDWLTSSASYATAVAGLATAQTTLTSATTDLATKVAVLAALVDATTPLKVYNTSGTTFVSVLYLNGTVVVKSVTM